MYWQGKARYEEHAGDSELMQCEQFVYLGAVISEDLACDKDVARRIGLAADIVRNLHKI